MPVVSILLKERRREDVTWCWATVQQSQKYCNKFSGSGGLHCKIPVHGKEMQGRVGTGEEQKMAR